MFDELVRTHPQFDRPPNYVGRLAYNRTLRPGIGWEAKSECAVLCGLCWQSPRKPGQTTRPTGRDRRSM
jgi:hypothetical protein